MRGLLQWSGGHIGRWKDEHTDLNRGAADIAIPAASAASSSSLSAFDPSTAAVDKAMHFQRQLSTLNAAEFIDLTCRVLAVNDERRQLLVWDGTDVQDDVPIVRSITQRLNARMRQRDDCFRSLILLARVLLPCTLQCC